jgi:hypothetical protein
MSARQACGHVDVWTSPLCVSTGWVGKNPGIMRKLSSVEAQDLRFHGSKCPHLSTRVHITQTPPYDKETFSKYTYFFPSLHEDTRGHRVDTCGRSQHENMDSHPHPGPINPGNTRKLAGGRLPLHNTGVHVSTVHTAPGGAR